MPEQHHNNCGPLEQLNNGCATKPETNGVHVNGVEQESTCNGGGRLLYVWCVPRCRSTALLRALTNRSDTVAYFEPLHNVLMSGPEGPVAQSDATAFKNQDAFQIDPEWTLANIAQGISRDLSEGKNVVVKDFAFGANLWLDKMPQPAGTKHVFLVRHPALCMASYLRGKLRMAPQYQTALSHFEQFLSAKGYNAFNTLENIYDKLKSQHAEIMVVHSERLTETPAETVEAVSRFAGLPFCPDQLTWQPTERHFPRNWVVSTANVNRRDKFKLTDKVLASNGLEKRPEDSLEQVQGQLAQHASPADMKSFQELMQHYKTFQSLS